MMTIDERHGWMQSYTGRKLYVARPDVDAVDPVDVAHALSLICRFGGMVPEHYSVAQHSILVSELVARTRPELVLAGLLHDASEYVLGDIVRPLKRHLGAVYTDLEQRWQVAIANKFGLDPAALDDPLVKLADNQALAIERRDFLDPELAPDWELLPEPPSLKGLSMAAGNLHFGHRLTAIPPQMAESEFLQRLSPPIVRSWPPFST